MLVLRVFLDSLLKSRKDFTILRIFKYKCLYLKCIFYNSESGDDSELKLMKLFKRIFD